MANTDYANVDELKGRVGIPTSNNDSNSLLQQVLNASAWVVDVAARNPEGCNRLPLGTPAFSATASGVTRVFDDTMDGVLDVDDLLTCDSFVRNDVTYDTQYFQLWPYNRGNGPATRILLRSDAILENRVLIAGSWYGFPLKGAGAGRISVTGTWGYCTLANRPDVVKEATLMQAERLYERLAVKAEDILNAMRDPYRAVDPLVKAVLLPVTYVPQAHYGLING